LGFSERNEQREKSEEQHDCNERSERRIRRVGHGPWKGEEFTASEWNK
jgi:hypothetical protein